MERQGIRFLEGRPPWKGEPFTNLAPLRRVLERLGSPHDSIKAIHIAGTNGKGSVAAAVSAILGSAGLNVGLNISPHLVRVNERIVVNGAEVDDEILNQALVEIERVCRELKQELSYFETVTTAAFLIFRSLNLDYAVFEVGLGGRLDATNVLSHPEVSAITSISLDHQAILGDTLEQIAYEKAGIAKASVPLVVGPVQASVREVILAQAVKVGARCRVYGEHYRVSREGDDGTAWYLSDRGIRCEFKPALAGEFQISNMAVAIEIARILGIEEKHWRVGVSRVYWPGRFETIQFKDSVLIMDGAHNPAGMNCAVSAAKASNINRLACVVGVLRTKQWSEMIDQLIPIASSWFLCEPNSEMALPAQELGAYLAKKGIPFTIIGRECANMVRLIAESRDTYFVTGSLYLLGEFRSLLGLKGQNLWERRVVT